MSVSFFLHVTFVEPLFLPNNIRSIPRELGRMTALQTLSIATNELTGEACTCGDASVIYLIVGNARVTAGFVH